MWYCLVLILTDLLSPANPMNSLWPADGQWVTHLCCSGLFWTSDLKQGSTIFLKSELRSTDCSQWLTGRRGSEGGRFSDLPGMTAQASEKEKDFWGSEGQGVRASHSHCLLAWILEVWLAWHWPLGQWNQPNEREAKVIGIPGPGAKGQGDIWPFDDRWQSREGQVKKGHGNRNDGNQGSGRSLCMSGSATKACLSFPLSVSRGCKDSRVRVGPQRQIIWGLLLRGPRSETLYLTSPCLSSLICKMRIFIHIYSTAMKRNEIILIKCLAKFWSMVRTQ